MILQHPVIIMGDAGFEPARDISLRRRHGALTIIQHISIFNHTVILILNNEHTFPWHTTAPTFVVRQILFFGRTKSRISSKCQNLNKTGKRCWYERGRKLKKYHNFNYVLSKRYYISWHWSFVIKIISGCSLVKMRWLIGNGSARGRDF